jgi:hypothetical protein
MRKLGKNKRDNPQITTSALIQELDSCLKKITTTPHKEAEGGSSNALGYK